MPNQTARFDGLTEGLAIKRPVRVATTANITLSGTQTIDGVAVVADDRVLVKNQTTASQNGIYKVASGTWSRAKDFDGNGDLVTGTRVLVTAGSTNIRREFCVTTANPIVIDTSSITFEQIPVTDDAGLLSSSTVLNVGSGQTYATLQAAADYLADKVIAADATVTIKVHGQVSTSTSVLWTVDHPQASRIVLVGNSDTISATIQSSGHTVTGSADNYTVTMKLNSVTGVSAGAVVLVRDPKNDDNQLFWGYDAALSTKAGKLTTSGTAMTLTSQTNDTIVADHIIIANGEARLVSARTNATTFTLASGFTQNITTQVYWHYIKKGTGTVGTGGASSVNVAGSSTDFLTRCTVGDILIAVEDGVPICRRISEVTSDTALVVDVAVTLTAGDIYGIWSMSKAHVGAFEITSVDSGANTITYSNLMNSTRVNLGANQLKGGTVEILPDSVKNTGGSGIIYSGGALQSINKLGIIGSNSSSYIGVYASNIRASAQHVYFGQYVGLVGWGIGLYVPLGTAMGDYLCIGNNVGAYGIFNYQGSVHTRYARISSSGTYCVFLGPNASHYDSNCIYVGGTTGLYSTSGAKRYADGSWAIGPNKLGFQAIASAGGHWVESRVLCAGSVGMSSTSGSVIRFAGSLIICTGDETPPTDESTGLPVSLAGLGVSINNGLGEGSYSWVSGSETRGFGFTDSNIELQYAASTGNSGEGFLSNGGIMDVRNVFAAKNTGRGVYQTGGGTTKANTSWSRYNGTADYDVANPGSIMTIDDFVYTSATLGKTRNVWTGGAIIIDTVTAGLVSMKTVTAITATQAFDFGSIAAGATVSATPTTVTGAAAGDAVVVTHPTNATVNGTINYKGVITATDQVTIVATNMSTGAVDPPNLTYTIHVFKST